MIINNHEAPSLEEIDGVSAFHSVRYDDEGMKMYRYIDIGPGKLVKY